MRVALVAAAVLVLAVLSSVPTGATVSYPINATGVIGYVTPTPTPDYSTANTTCGGVHVGPIGPPYCQPAYAGGSINLQVYLPSATLSGSDLGTFLPVASLVGTTAAANVNRGCGSPYGAGYVKVNFGGYHWESTINGDSWTHNVPLFFSIGDWGSGGVQWSADMSGGSAGFGGCSAFDGQPCGGWCVYLPADVTVVTAPPASPAAAVKVATALPVIFPAAGISLTFQSCPGGRISAMNAPGAPPYPGSVVGLLPRYWELHTDMAPGSFVTGMALTYDPAEVPAGNTETNLVVYTYDTGLATWVVLPTAIDPTLHQANVSGLTHFSVFVLGISGATAARHESWGKLKAIYR